MFQHRRSQGGPKGPWPPKFLENIVILYFEKRFSKQNGVIRLKSNVLPTAKCLGWLRHCISTDHYESVVVLSSKCKIADEFTVIF